MSDIDIHYVYEGYNKRLVKKAIREVLQVNRKTARLYLASAKLTGMKYIPLPTSEHATGVGIGHTFNRGMDLWHVAVVLR